ncbi:MAG: hypothetical protein ABJ275_12205 [Maricaulaceae bacterium]
MAHQFTKKVGVLILSSLSILAYAGNAQAQCNDNVCRSGTHPAYNPPSISSWSSQHSHNTVKVSAPAYRTSGVTYASTPRYSSASSLSTAACPAGSSKQSDGTCLLSGSSSLASSSVVRSGSTLGTSYRSSTQSGSGSISRTFSDYSVAPLTSSVLSGLGANESLQSTTCPVSVHNPSGAKVLGCYNVVKPAPKPVVRTVVKTVPTVYRVVRPVVYVRTPVPVCNTCCSPETVYSRYGGAAFNGVQTFNGGNRCGW